ncbi:DUF3383 family protein [Paenibacillus xylanexedens]|uniref:DUF3383 family protein n=1 Tax=Paenibacillus xylanexedens TaxID=528191 RepID=UPI000F53C6BF|nr:DUF3383 family protein [Paenibacillus xylanexedens]RPK29867.1 hypothetical protein EDO6_00491 [Paenibacillus xylanexedens]
MAKDVNVIIEIETPTPRLGIGKPLILGSATAGKPYKTYTELSSVKLDYAESTEEYKAAYALLNQGDDSPAEIAIACQKTGTEPESIDDVLGRLWKEDWYFLITTTTLQADVDEFAAAIEQNNSREYFTRSSTLADVALLLAKNYSRTTVFYHIDISNYPEAALIGRVGSAPVGSVTWKFKFLQGIVPLDITDTELREIHAAGAITYVTKAGRNQTSEGKTLSGEWIDVIHAKDYIKANIEYGIQILFADTDKVSFDNTGIAQLESVTRNVLRQAFLQKMIAQDDDGLPLYGTNFKRRSEVDPADRAQRKYNGGEFWFELAGAIHETTIRGVIRK